MRSIAYRSSWIRGLQLQTGGRDEDARAVYVQVRPSTCTQRNDPMAYHPSNLRRCCASHYTSYVYRSSSWTSVPSNHSSQRLSEPPAPHAVREAVQTLSELQALEGPQETLTPLGHHLATLPVDVRIGKMLIFGCMLRCLHPILVIAAAPRYARPSSNPLTSEMRHERQGGASPQTRVRITLHCCECTRCTGRRWLEARRPERSSAATISSHQRLLGRWSKSWASLSSCLLRLAFCSRTWRYRHRRRRRRRREGRVKAKAAEAVKAAAEEEAMKERAAARR